MPNADLPDHASLEYLKKLAKQRLRELRRSHPGARLSEAQLTVAREHGFGSWRALKADVERRRAPALEAFLAACAAGDVARLRDLLDQEPGLIRERRRDGATGLHLAVPHPDAVQLLLQRGADPNVRDKGDNALPLHFAAGGGHTASARALLDAGSDVHGVGDLHRLEPIGWATVFGPAHRETVDLLVERGARHHVFSAIALGDVALLRRVVAEDREALRRRLSRYEREQTALHYVIAPPDGLLGGTFRTGAHYPMVEALIELGADLEAPDARGRTPLAIAMLRGDGVAMRLLHAAGAREPELPAPAPAESLASFAASIERLSPMLAVRDMETTVEWYRSLGFELHGSHASDGRLDWASLSLGGVEIMFVPAGDPARQRTAGLSLWIATDRLDQLYAVLKRRQLARARASLTEAGPNGPEVRFTLDLHTAFYGQREFGILDPDGVELMFMQPLKPAASRE